MADRTEPRSDTLQASDTLQDSEMRPVTYQEIVRPTASAHEALTNAGLMEVIAHAKGMLAPDIIYWLAYAHEPVDLLPIKARIAHEAFPLFSRIKTVQEFGFLVHSEQTRPAL